METCAARWTRSGCEIGLVVGAFGLMEDFISSPNEPEAAFETHAGTRASAKAGRKEPDRNPGSNGERRKQRHGRSRHEYEFSKFVYKDACTARSRDCVKGESTKVAFTITWSGDEFPGTKHCVTVATLHAGARKSAPFTLTSVDRWARADLKVPIPLDELERVTLVCS